MEWISVKDSLPKRGVLVFTATAAGGYTTDYLTSADLFSSDHPICYGDPVTHWHPITPPTPEGEQTE